MSPTPDVRSAPDRRDASSTSSGWSARRSMPWAPGGSRASRWRASASPMSSCRGLASSRWSATSSVRPLFHPGAHGVGPPDQADPGAQPGPMTGTILLVEDDETASIDARPPPSRRRAMRSWRADSAEDAVASARAGPATGARDPRHQPAWRHRLVPAARPRARRRRRSARRRRHRDHDQPAPVARVRRRRLPAEAVRPRDARSRRSSAWSGPSGVRADD